MKLRDQNKTVDIRLIGRGGVDVTVDFFEAEFLPYDEETNTYSVGSVDYCIGQAKDCIDGVGDFYDPENPDFETGLYIDGKRYERNHPVEKNSAKKRKSYYAYYPRNFSNEYVIYSVEDAADFQAIRDLKERISGNSNASLCRVTSKQVMDMQKAERDRRINDQSFSGFCNPIPVPAREM